MSSDEKPWCSCRNCGTWFQAGWRVRGYSLGTHNKSKKQMTCSKKCADERREVLRIKRTVCVTCGGPKNSSNSSTCSKECSTKLRSLKSVGMKHNLCNYTAPNEFDYMNMLEILHRKGYVKAKDTEEKWTYTTSGFPSISWVDRLAREAMVSGEASPGEEQQGHEDGVQHKVEEVGASAMSLEELLGSTQAGAALLEATMGIKPSYRG